jgi:hypothetical protein
MRRIAALSRGEREKMGLQGRQKVRQEFEKNMVVRKTMEAIFG